MKTVKLSDICEFNATTPKEVLTYVGMEDVESGTGRFLGDMEPRQVKSTTSYFDENCVLYGKLRPYLNKVLVPSFEGHCSTEFVILRPNLNAIDRHYLRYFLISPDTLRKLSASTTGTRMPRVNLAVLKDLDIMLPSLDDQQKTAAKLDVTFRRIDRVVEQIEANRLRTQLLFDSFNNKIYESIFSTGPTRLLKSAATVVGGFSFKSKEFTSSGKYQVLRMGNVRNGALRLNERPVHINHLDKKTLEKSMLKPGDVIITQTGTKNKRDYGYTAIITGQNLLLNQRIAAIKFRDSYDPTFFLYFSWTSIFRDQYFANETGTVGQGNVGIGAITHSSIPDIDLRKQREIVNSVRAMREQTVELRGFYELKLSKLAKLKNSMLNELSVESTVR
jgi:type I restriction enzyme, S subunit